MIPFGRSVEAKNAVVLREVDPQGAERPPRGRRLRRSVFRMNGRCRSGRARRRAALAPVIGFAVIVLLSLQLIGCGGTQARQKRYKADWGKTMGAFEAQVKGDDAKANDFVKKNDLPGLIALVNQRIKSLEDTSAKILVLSPPQDLWKLQAVTLYYLVSLIDQLKSQNDLNEAALSGKPTTDLKSIADTAKQKTQAVGAELGIELQKNGIRLQAGKTETGTLPEGKKPKEGQEIKPKQTTPK